VQLRETENLPNQAQKKLRQFLGNLSGTSSRVLMLDYDGTLAPFCAQRQLAGPYPEIPSLLKQILTDTNTRLTIVTGRRAEEIGKLVQIEEIETWGCQGLERITDSQYWLATIDKPLLERIEEAEELLRKAGLVDLLDPKPGAIAIHWRGSSLSPEEVATSVKKVWARLPSREGLHLVNFDGGLEIRTRKRNKGDVVRTIIDEMPQRTAIAYLGDDQTDEDAFAALQGFGLGVLVRPLYRPTVADVWIRPPEGVISFLENWIRTCRGGS